MVWIIGVAALSLLVCLPFYEYYKGTPKLALALAFKVIGTLCAASLVLVAALKLDPRCWVLLIGMLLHTAGDVLLEIRFPIGLGLFLAGHIVYIAFFTNLFPVSVLHLVCFAVLAAVLGFLLWQWRKAVGKQMPLFIFYGLTLCAMSACAIAGGVSAHTSSGILIALGGASFLVSDAVYLRRLLFPSPRWLHPLIMLTYFGAQLLFGAACLLL